MQTNQALRILLGTAALVIIVAGMKSSAELFVPFLLACFISILCAPLMSWMTAHKVPAGISVTMIVLMLIGLFMVSGSLLGASTQALRDNIPEYRDSFNALLQTLAIRLNNIGIAVDENLLSNMEPSSALAWVGTIFASLRDMLIDFIIIIFIVAFVLLEANTLPAKIQRAFGDNNTLGYTKRFTDNVKKYLVIKAWISLATGILIGLAVWAIGLDYPLLWGLLAFFLNFVPSIGSFLASLPAIAVALVTGGWLLASYTAIIFIIANTLIGNIIEPRIMGANMGLSPLVVFSSLIIWGWILGPVGILLAVPLTMVLHIALQSHPDTQWLAVLLERARRE